MDCAPCLIPSWPMPLPASCFCSKDNGRSMSKGAAEGAEPILLVKKHKPKSSDLKSMQYDRIRFGIVRNMISLKVRAASSLPGYRSLASYSYSCGHVLCDLVTGAGVCVLECVVAVDACCSTCATPTAVSLQYGVQQPISKPLICEVRMGGGMR